MAKYCMDSSENSERRSDSRARIIGIVLIAIGVLVLLFFVPYWVWTAVLAVLLISIGFLLWRFG